MLHPPNDNGFITQMDEENKTVIEFLLWVIQERV